MEPQVRVQVDADPDFQLTLLGEPPEIALEDQPVWDEFWSIRSSVPSDQPVDLLRALEWYERLYGPTDAHVFGRKVRAMDGEFLRSHGERMKAKANADAGADKRPPGLPRKGAR